MNVFCRFSNDDDYDNTYDNSYNVNESVNFDYEFNVPRIFILGSHFQIRKTIGRLLSKFPKPPRLIIYLYRDAFIDRTPMPKNTLQFDYKEFEKDLPKFYSKEEDLLIVDNCMDKDFYYRILKEHSGPIIFGTSSFNVHQRNIAISCQYLFLFQTKYNDALTIYLQGSQKILNNLSEDRFLFIDKHNEKEYCESLLY